MARNKFDVDEQIEERFNPHIVMRLFKWINHINGKCFCLV